jgi:hypothetical protein
MEYLTYAKDIKESITSFTKNWFEGLERLPQLIFFDSGFEKALAANETERFLREFEGLQKCLNKAGLMGRINFPTESSYPVLHALFKPLFDLLAQANNFVWGGINYWDCLRRTFYTEQFTTFKVGSDNERIFTNVMKELLFGGLEQEVLPLTTFVFEKCKRVPVALLFYRDSLRNFSWFDLTVQIQRKISDKKQIRNEILSCISSPSKLIEILRDLIGKGDSIFLKLPNTISVHEKDWNELINLFKIFEIVTPDPSWNRLYYTN